MTIEENSPYENMGSAVGIGAGMPNPLAMWVAVGLQMAAMNPFLRPYLPKR